MMGGGVETPGGRDQFPGALHAQEHFAPCFAVVAGGLQNVGDALGRVAVLQEAQDGLSVGRVDGTGAQARELAVVTFAQPVDGGDAGFRGMNVVGQRDRLGAEGMFGRKQELVAVAGWVGSQQQARACGLEQG